MSDLDKYIIKQSIVFMLPFWFGYISGKSDSTWITIAGVIVGSHIVHLIEEGE